MQMVTEPLPGLLPNSGNPDWRSNALAEVCQPRRTICVFGRKSAFLSA
jgi:hypothetical protein